MPDRRRWTILAVGTLAQAATCTFIYGMPFVVPALRAELQLSLLGASLLVSAPIAGVLLTLILWGALADRYGERVVIASGVGAAAVVLAATWFTHGPVALAALLVLAGACAASVNAASGRMIMGWFPRSERGLAMGIRQTAQPLGVAIAAVALPGLAREHGVHGALLFPAGLCAALALAVVGLAADPQRVAPASGVAPARSPYRGSWHLARVHLASTMLVVPQFAVAAFTLVYLVGQRHWDPTTAGRMIFGFQAAGALGRIATGVWSDRVGSRLRPMRQLAVAAAALMLALSLGAALHSVWIIAAFGLAAVITVADNGLAYTSVAELAGTEWSGRALGVHNTLQNLAAVATAPVLAAIIGDSRYALAFAMVALFPIAAVALTPVHAEAVAPAEARLPVP